MCYSLERDRLTFPHTSLRTLHQGQVSQLELHIDEWKGRTFAQYEVKGNIDEICRHEIVLEGLLVPIVQRIVGEQRTVASTVALNTL